MSKLTRVFQKQFGVNAGNSDVGIFGSLAASNPQYSKDPETIQSLNAFLTGWAAETIANNRPALEDFNALDFLAFYQLCYLFQAGVPEWDAETTYYIGSIVNNGTGVLYKSLANDNLNNAVTDATKWALVNPDPVTAITGEVRMWGGTIADVPEGWLFCNGAEVSRSTYAALFSAIGVQYGAGNGSSTFNLPDMRNYFPVGANADSDGAAKATSNFDTTAYKTKTECNQFYITNDTPSGGGGAALNNAYFNGKTNRGDSAGRVASYPNYVAFAFIIKY